MRRLMLAGGAVLWGLLVYVVGLHVHFPGEAALERARWEVQERSDGAWAIDASRAGLWRLSGVEVEDLVLLKVDKPTPTRRRRPLDEEEDFADEPLAAAVPFLRAERARARLSLLPLLRGETEVAFDADVYGGNLAGTVAQGEVRRRLVLDGEDLDLSRIPIEGDDWSIDAAGLASLKADLDLDSEDPKASTGTLGLRVEDLAFRQATVFGMELEPTTFTEAVLELQVDEGKAEIETGSFVSDLFELEMSGNVTLSAREWSRWRVKVDLNLSLSESLDGMARFVPQLKDAKGEDDRYHLTCTGSLARPRCREDRSVPGVTASRPRPRRTPVARGGDLLGAPDKLDDDDDDASGGGSSARERRLERIRERRERLRKRREERAAERGASMDEEDEPMLDGPRGIGQPRDFGGDEPMDDFEPPIDDFDGDGRPGFDPGGRFVPPDDFDQDAFEPPINGPDDFGPKPDDMDYQDDFNQ